MGISEIQSGQRWRLINIVSRPDVFVKSVDIYSEVVYWYYKGESRVNESKADYFLKTFKRVE